MSIRKFEACEIYPIYGIPFMAVVNLKMNNEHVFKQIKQHTCIIIIVSNYIVVLFCH